MKSVVALASALFLTMAASDAGAVTKYKYTYVGNPIPLERVFFPGDEPEAVLEPGYVVSLVLDENQLIGGTLRNATVELTYQILDEPTEVSLDGLVALRSVGNPDFDFDPTPGQLGTDCCGTIQLRTDANRAVVDYSLVYRGINGPYQEILPSGDYYADDLFPEVFEYQNDAPGTWTVAPVPVPAAMPLALAGIGALALGGWRRKRRPTG